MPAISLRSPSAVVSDWLIAIRPALAEYRHPISREVTELREGARRLEFRGVVFWVAAGQIDSIRVRDSIACDRRERDGVSSLAEPFDGRRIPETERRVAGDGDGSVDRLRARGPRRCRLGGRRLARDGGQPVGLERFGSLPYRRGRQRRLLAHLEAEVPIGNLEVVVWRDPAEELEVIG